METNIEFQQKKLVLDYLYIAKLITGIEWYESLCILMNEKKANNK